ncbi:hypothetical protein CcI49_28150 [Frankia sp. CcI49]|nr:hypothetical protein CcI49_28150 [Frankia sp. CcI49]
MAGAVIVPLITTGGGVAGSGLGSSSGRTSSLIRTPQPTVASMSTTHPRTATIRHSLRPWCGNGE